MGYSLAVAALFGYPVFVTFGGSQGHAARLREWRFEQGNKSRVSVVILY